MEIFDTHTYLNTDDFAGCEAEELVLAKEMGVTRHNVVGFDVPTIKRAIELAEEYPEFMSQSVGTQLKLALIIKRLRI
ncbi:protein of unknown function [Streptococcus thermophilus]|nr:TatD family hydrolase [Streptococcus thermophilus]CAD0164273.1 protein of unknown function [Streptococcus thermophilus]